MEMYHLAVAVAAAAAVAASDALSRTNDAAGSVVANRRQVEQTDAIILMTTGEMRSSC